MNIYLDTETTGLNKNGTDEILEISMIDEKGEILLDTLVQPTKNTEWKIAKEIHGISPEMVKSAPTFGAIRKNIERIINGNNVIIYNADYDSQFLMRELRGAKKVQCCMLKFAEFYGEPGRYGGYKWQKLDKAARIAGHEWTGKAHRALADTKATKTVWEYLQSNIVNFSLNLHMVELLKEYKELQGEINVQGGMRPCIFDEVRDKLGKLAIQSLGLKS
jgi:DNA polymerase III epsilon subunit-like protein